MFSEALRILNHNAAVLMVDEYRKKYQEMEKNLKKEMKKSQEMQERENNLKKEMQEMQSNLNKEMQEQQKILDDKDKQINSQEEQHKKDLERIAEYNSKLNGVSYVEFVKSNMFAELRDTGVKFDVIVSNPPYIPTKDIRELSDEVKLHDPLLALDGDEDGLKFYRAITRNAVNYLNNGGYLCYEIGYNQAQDVSDILVSCGYNDIRVVKDLAGLDRVVIARYY